MMSKNRAHETTLAVRVLDALSEAADLMLTDDEHECALLVIEGFGEAHTDIAFARRVVDAVETAIGLGLDEGRYAAAASAVNLALVWTKLHGCPAPAPAEDAHLEMQYEGRFEPDFAMD